MTGKTLVIAEKPSVARDIARVMHARARKEGYYEGDAYLVTWALGHLVALCDPDELDPAYKKWRMDALPILPKAFKTKVLPKTRPQYSAVKKLLLSGEVSRVVCATDSGREGELIFRLIYRQAGCKKPFDRLWISSMTDEAIRDGFQNLRPGSEYDPLYASARLRSEADWLVGMNASRAFTLRYNALLSVGRVQTPTLSLIVKRDREIAAFVPEDYFEVRANFSDYEGLWYDEKADTSRIKSREQAAAITSEVRGGEGAVVTAKRERKKAPPPLLYDLTTLQRDANKRLGLSAQKTLDIAQVLYERHKVITYPRTDSSHLPPDMEGKVKGALLKLPEPYHAFVESLPSPLYTGKRVYDGSKVTDHHAIVPIDKRIDLSPLTADERSVFDLIARRFVAAHEGDYEYESAFILTKVKTHLFASNGTTPLVMGWRALYQGVSGDDGEEKPSLPAVKVGDRRKVVSVNYKALKTKPPAHLTDATLLAQMERAGKNLSDEELRETMKDSGLGTPATRAATIERLLQVGYIQRKGKSLVATDKGMRLLTAVPEEIASPETTGKWEKALNAISRTQDPGKRGELEKRFSGGIERFTGFLVDYAQSKAPNVAFDREERTQKTRSGKRRVVTAKATVRKKDSSK